MSNSKKRILYVSYNNPFSYSYGAEQRASILLQAALNNGFTVDVAFIGPLCTPQPDISKFDNVKIVLWGVKDELVILSKWVRIKSHILCNPFPEITELHNIINTIVKKENYDYIMTRYIPYAGKAGLLKYSDRLILDIDDLPLQIVQTNAMDNVKNALYKKILTLFITHQIKRWIKKSYVTYLPNKSQASLWGTKHLPNIPTISVEKTTYTNNNTSILFIGMLAYGPNRDGIEWFVESVLPLVAEKAPQVQLLIAGKGLPTTLYNKLTNKSNINVLGFVDDILDFYRQGNIVICPIFSGGGTNIKVIEAMAMGKSCVMTQFSTKGFETIIKDGENAYIAKDANEYANKIITLIRNPTVCQEMQENALKTAKKYYTQNTINDIFANTVNLHNICSIQ